MVPEAPLECGDAGVYPALVYPVNETALWHGAGVKEETSEPSVAHARFSADEPVPCPEELPGF